MPNESDYDLILVLNEAKGQYIEFDNKDLNLQEIRAKASKLKNIEKQINKIKKETISAEDPLLPVRDMMIQFIKNSDISSLEEGQELLSNLSTGFIEAVSPRTDWSPENDLLDNFTHHILELLSTLLEVAVKENLESAQKVILALGYNYSLKLFENNHFKQIDLLNDFFQNVADRYIARIPYIFIAVIQYYEWIGKKAFESLKNNPPTKPADERIKLIEDVSVSVGWLGERLILKVPIEETPLMLNHAYNNEFDALFNCLFEFSSSFTREQPTLYPLLIFDALEVVILRLIPVYKKDKHIQTGEIIYRLTNEFAQFATEAIDKGNGNGTYLALIKIRNVYLNLRKEELNENALSVLGLLIDIGLSLAGTNVSVSQDILIGKSLENWIIDAIVDSNENIDSQVYDGYIRIYPGQNQEKLWHFITRLGYLMQSSFGFDFDYRTGMHF